VASFTQIGSKWQARIRKPGFPSTSANFATLLDAKEWAAETETAMNKKKFKDKRAFKDLTFGKLVDQHFEKEKLSRPFGKTKKANLTRIKRMLGDVLLPALTFDRLITFVEDREVQGAGGVTIGMDVAEIANVLRSCNKAYKCDFDPKLFTEVREYMAENGLDPKSKHRDRRPTEKELTMLKKHFNQKDRQQIPMSTIIDFAVASAMRASEITRIKWSDVDFNKKTVIIRDRKHPKRKRDQVVPLLGKAWEIVLAQPRTDDCIFPYEAKTFSTIFPRARKACGIVDLRFHDLRHEAASRLFERGYDIPRVALVTGHMDWKMLERYTQLRPEDLHPDEDGNLSWQKPKRNTEPAETQP
jgi:integrase